MGGRSIVREEDRERVDYWEDYWERSIERQKDWEREGLGDERWGRRGNVILKGSACCGVKEYH